MGSYSLPQTFLKNPHLHAYLYLSSDSTARSDMALSMAKAMLCENKDKEGNPCGKCPLCIKAQTKTHPDIIYVSGTEKTGVGDIRKIEDEAYLAPNEADGKVFILENADEYNVQSQNALLKIIEEPPGKVRFILTAASVSAILPTVRSRVVAISGDIKDRKDIDKDIRSVKKNLTDEQIYMLCGYVSYYDKADIKQIDEVRFFEYAETATDYLSSKDSLALTKLPKKREELMTALQVLMLFVLEVATAKSMASASPSFLTDKTLREIASKMSAKKAMQLYDVFEEAYLQTGAYANINAVMSYLLQNAK